MVRIRTCFLRLYILLFAVYIPTATSGVIGLCSPEVNFDTAYYSQEYYLDGGEQRQLVIADDPLPAAECQSADFPGSAEDVLWSTPMSSAIEGRPEYPAVILQGLFADSGSENTSISEVIPLANNTGNRSSTSTLANQQILFGQNLLESFMARVFGVEERARWRSDKRLNCEPGTRPAGVLLQNTVAWPQDESASLTIVASGQGTFSLGVSDRGRLRSEEALAIGQLRLAGDRQSRRISLPANSNPWRALTVACPAAGGQLELAFVSVLPTRAAESDLTGLRRSAWMWSPAIWQQDRELLWRLQQRSSIDELFLTVPLEIMEGQGVSVLSEFVEEASDRGVQVWPVVGDRRDVLPDSLSMLLRRVSAYARYNETADEKARLSGVQLDVEPYLLAGFGIDPAFWSERYLEMVAAVKQAAGDRLPVDLVIPVWWSTHAAWGERFLNELAEFDISLTVMNYRTDMIRLYEESLPFARWSERNQRDLRIALEAGPLQDELRRTYSAGSIEGELWQIRIGNYPVLMLFSRPKSGLIGDAFTRSFESPYPASNLSFNGDLNAINVAAEFLQQRLAQWTYFRGIAFHGLDTVAVQAEQ